MLCKHTKWFGLFLEEVFWNISFFLENLFHKLSLNEKEICDFCQCLSRVPISLLAAGLAAEKIKLEICSLNHQDSVRDCWTRQHSLSSPVLDFSLHNSDTLGKTLSMAKQTWIWWLVCVPLCLPALPGGLSPTVITPKQLVFLKLYPRANSCSFTGVSVGSSKS